MIKRLHLSLFLFLFISTLAGAADRFWVGGSGTWDDVKHWSVTSGGKGGASVPVEFDHIIFDKASFTSEKNFIEIKQDISVSRIDFTGLKFEPDFFLGYSVSVTFNVAGQTDLSWKQHFESRMHSVNELPEYQAVYPYPGKQPVNTNVNKTDPNVFNHSCVASVIVPVSCPFNATNNNSQVPPLNCNAQATVTVNPPTGCYKYIWSDGQTTQTATGLCPGPFTGFVIDTCEIPLDSCPFSVFVNGLNNFNPSFNKVKPLCFGGCDGSIQLNLAGGTPPYSYSWSTSPSQSGITATGLCAGSYTCYVTDANGCKYTTPTTILTQPTILTLSFSQTNPLCFGQCTGTATVNIGGGTPVYTYSWNTIPVQNNPTATGLCAGNYTCFVTDANGCPIQHIFTITQPTLLLINSITTTNNPLACNGNCNATATANASGGTPTYTYSWNTAPTQSGMTATGLCVGNYTVTVTDQNGCTRTGNVSITQPTILTVTATTTNNPLLCNGSCNATATATAGGGIPPYTYSWNTTPTQSGITATGLCAGNYTVTVTDANLCTRQANVVITQPPPIVITITTTFNPLTCFGNCNATATANVVGGTPGYTYSWNTSPAQLTQTATGLCAGTYIVFVKDANLCPQQLSVTITQPTQITINISTTNNPLACNSNCNATATANAAGGTPGYTYSWNTAPTQSGVTATGLCAGNYQVTVTDAAGCTRTANVSITQPPVLTLTLNNTILLCNGACNATIGSSVSGGVAPYTYSWSPVVATTPSITGQCAGTYTLTVTDANLCTVTAQVTITQPTALTLSTANNPATCFGACNGSASAIAGGGTPGYSYNWSPGGQTTSTITSQCAGNYNVTVTDANGCTITALVVITEPPAVVPGVTSTNVLCNGQCNGTATASASGGTPGYTYSWAPGALTTSSISNLCPGSYTLTVTDANGCTATQTVTITQPPPLGASAFPTGTACNICNGSANVNPFGGAAPYTYSWAPSGQTTQSATGLCPGTYTVTITDANGCSTTATCTVVQTVVITITSSSTNLLCFGDSSGTACANAVGGQQPYAYLWTPTNPFQTTQCATGLTAGSYTVNVTDANGCTGIDSVTFTNPPQLIGTATFTNLSCNNACDGTASASAVGGAGGYTYSWLPGNQTGSSIGGLCAGTYTLFAFDANGCQDTNIFNITQAQPLAANGVTVNTNCTLCNGSITLTPSGGVPGYTYLWSPGAQTTSTINNLCVGIYTVVITDAANCTTQFTFTINPINGPSITTIVTNASCNGSCDGAITANVSGGTPGYTYLWTPGNMITPTINALCAGNYQLTVTDAVGCQAFVIVTITQPQPISPNAISGNSSCASNCDGTVVLNTTGGTGPYTYSWTTIPSQSTSTATGLCAGSYTVTITDANNCTDTSSYVITQPLLLTSVVSSTNVNCFGACDGTGTVTPSGGTPAYLYSWAPNVSSLPNVINLCPGTYTVFITDANNCVKIDSITITQPTQMVSVNSFTDATCFGTCDGTATVNPSGATGPYTYSWSPGAMTTQTVNNLCAGIYNCTITDANGCTLLQIITIGQPVQILPNATTVPVSCNGACNGSATAVPTGGAGGPYTFSWAPGGQLTQTANGLCAGQYTVTITDLNGCTGTQTVTITQPNPLIANPSIVVPATCANACNGTLTANPLGGTAPYSYSWVPGAMTTQTVGGLCGGTTYSVYVTDANGCMDMQTILMTGPNTLTAIFSVAQANCNVCDGQITANPSGGVPPYTYSWAPIVATTQTVTGLCAGLYSVTVTDANGCTQLLTIGVSNTTGPALTLTSTQTSCPGICDGTVTVLAAGNSPFTYLWTTSGQTTTTATGLCANSYTVQVIDVGLCQTIDSIQVTSPSVILDNAVVVSPQCAGVCNGSITLTPSGANGGPYTFLWNTLATTPGINGLCVGTYSVVVTDANGCTNSFSYTLLGNTNIVVATSSTNINCSSICNGTATITSTIGGVTPYTYQWSDPNGQFTLTATGLCAGTYTAFVTDANGCVGIDSTTITQTPPVTATSAVTPPSCGLCNGVLTATPSGGQAPYTILWNTGATTTTINGVCAGVYSAVITDANGCTATVTFPVSNASTLADNVTVVNATCFSSPCSGSATANASGGTPPYSYNWIPGGQTTSTVNGLCGGTYFVQVIDAAGCIRTDSVVIGSATQIISNQLVTNTACGTCNGIISLAPSGGTGPYTYLWLPGNQTTSSINSLCAGTYTVTITDAIGCTQQYIIPITTFNGPTVTVTASNVVCNGNCDGTATPTVIGGQTPYSFSWSTGATTPTIANLCPGNYWVQVTDANGCTATAVFTITQPPAIIFSTAISVDPLCFGDCNGSVNVIPSGGTLPLAYSWAPGAQTTSGISGQCAGTYTCYVTDANSCSSNQVITLVAPPALTLSNVITPASCNTVADGSIDITVGGGTLGYTYVWSNAATTQDLNNVLAGNYTVTVTDANNCTITGTFTIGSSISVISDAGVDDTLCVGSCTLLIATASVNAQSFIWIDITTNTVISNNDSISVCPGTGSNSYALICTNGPCTDTDTVVVFVNPLPVADGGPTQSILVNSSTTIGGNPTGPLGSTYSWSPSTGLSCTTCSNPTASPSVTTTYTVTVTSPQGCVSSDTVTVIVVPEIIFPNGISPNGDGANDEWIIDNIDLYPNCVVEVYNRWGELLFRSVGYPPDDRWKGIYKGKELPVGTYYYIIDLKSEFYPDAFTGPITLMR